MLIKALCDYADKQSAKSADDPPEGWEWQDIHYRIKLSKDGDLLGIFTAAPQEGKKIASTKIKLPFRAKTTTIKPYTIEHRPLYIFGLNYEKGVFTPNDDKNKARKSHEAFVKSELELLEGIDSDICNAYRKFIEKWVPENETENLVLKQLGSNYKGKSFGFSFGIGEKNLEDDEQLIEKYNRIVSEMNNENEDTDSDADTAVCGILGERLPIERVHDYINFRGGTSNGCKLVSMKSPAFESYGKKQSFNSNISKKAMKKYTSTLNKLLSDKKHRAYLDDMTIIYFAIKENDEKECDWFSAFISKSDSFSDDEAEQIIAKAMKYAKEGYTADSEAMAQLEADSDVTFYIAGFTPDGPESPRICTKFIYRDKFGMIIKNLAKHQLDLKINEENNRPVYFSGIAKQLISPKSAKDKDNAEKSKKEKVSPALMTNIMMSALNGTKYPDGLFATVIRRIKTDSDDEKSSYTKLNDTRAGIIKACLNRKYNREEITMSWNSGNKNQAYLCGGLFAVYEKIQQDSSGGELNRTIKDAYFASACSRPASVFPKLAKLSQNHLRKLSEGSSIYYSRLTDDLFYGLNGEFPQTLDLDDQGRFIVGYYQMRKKLFTSTKTTEKND